MGNYSDIESFNQLFNAYYERFIRFACGYVKDRQLAEDFVSEAFTVFWEKRKEHTPDTKPQAYILTTVKNKCLNHLKHLQVRQKSENMISAHAEWKLNMSINTLEACDPGFLFSEEILMIIDKTLNRLPKRTKHIFLLNRYEDLSYREIAQKMNLSSKAVEYHISEALSQLRFSLKEFICISPFLLIFC